jgi:hypothetical protein
MMGYSNFKKIQQVTERFGLEAEIKEFISPKLKSVKPSHWLKQSLDYSSQMPLTNEKNKAERIISPILLEVSMFFKHAFTLFSGEEISINASEDLSGSCDFFFALHPPKPYMEAPVISLAEAKNEDMEWGIAQCAGQMYGAWLYNESKKRPVEIVFGCATTGIEWRFMKFDSKTFTIDMHSITEIPKILGTWHFILQQFKKS